MSDQTALLATIRDNPDDDTPRLVYADWLDENATSDADRARAEFIRVQIELAHYQELLGPDEHARWKELFRREQDLLGIHGPGWVGRIPVDEFRLRVSPRTITFRRGFPEIGDFHIDYLRDSVRDVLAHPLLRILSVSGIDDRSLPELLAFPWLSELRGLTLQPGSGEWPNGGYVPSDWGRLADCPHLSRLESLCLWGNGALTPERAIRVADNSALAGVRDFQLLEPPRTRPVSSLLSGTAFRSLRSLDLQAGEHPYPPVPPIGENPRLSVLGRLTLRGYAIDRSAADAITRAPFWPSLRELTLGEGRLEPEAIEVFGAASGGRLETLCLVQNLPAEPGRLFGPVLRTVRTLHLLSHAQMNAGVVAQLADCEYAIGLRSLTFSCQQIGDTEAALIARSPVFSGLYRLDLMHSGVGSAGAVALAESPYLKQICSLNLFGCRIANEAKATLRKRFGTNVWLD